jgi:hypothetical protein
MEATELNAICSSIRNTVASWLSRQDEITCAIHRIIVEAIQAGCEAPPLFVIQDLHDQYPEGWPDYCETAVAFRAAELLNSEFKVLSQLFSSLYEDFNRRYFGASLPVCHVRVMHNLPLPEQPYTATEVCAQACRAGEILLHYHGWPKYMVERLVHMMVLIQCGPGHDADFETALTNVRCLGASPSRTPRLASVRKN